MLLNVSNSYLYYDTGIIPISDHHRPYFLALGGERERSNLLRILKEKGIKLESPSDAPEGPLSLITDLGQPETFQSFSRPGTHQDVFRVYTRESHFVPQVSDHLFFKHGFYTAEHDIPYVHRAASDLAAQDEWFVDSGREDQQLKVLFYNIETPN